MTSPPIVETFNTHRMTADVVTAVATGRADELEEVMTAIRRAAATPSKPPQPLIVYGERGSGKSFLMRMVEIASSGLPDVACALLPEEQYNIRSAPQIIEAVAAHVRGDAWVAASYRLDLRPPAEAWDEAVAALHAALDARYGAGRGIAIALIENFDTMIRNLFGKEPPASGGKASPTAVERRAAEERLRKLMNAKGGRFMLIATATGTVDLDYERPLFQAFHVIDLSPWSSEASIDYFNRRRALENLPPLSEAETARARAIVEFIGGNPRLTQLLGNVLGSSDAHSIADTLDRLSDQLADYYRRRLDDLPPAAAGLLDVLIRGGEPRSQSNLAELVGAQQNQIADAFSFLTRSRLVAAVTERAGAATLYRVKDRLFVHFYRRRYGEGQRARGLAPIAELLEHFFTAQERELQIRRHLERGEFDDARAFGRLSLGVSGVDEGFCNYRDGIVHRAASRIFVLAGLRPDELEDARAQLRDHPAQAFKQWGERARAATDTLSRTVALLLQARAASRQSLDPIARSTLHEAVVAAQDDSATDALVIAHSELAQFEWLRAGNQPGALELLRSQQTLLDRCGDERVRLYAYLDIAFAALYERRVQAGADAAEHAVEIGLRLGGRSETVALLYLSWARQLQHRYEEAVALSERTEAASLAANDTYDLAESRRLLAYSLGELSRHEEAVRASESAVALSAQLHYARGECDALNVLAWNEMRLKHFDDATRHVDRAVAIAERMCDWAELSEILTLKSTNLRLAGAPAPALEIARAALAAARRTGRVDVLNNARYNFFMIAGEAAAPEIVTEFAAALADDPTTEPHRLAVYLDDVLAAVARVGLWHDLFDSMRTQTTWIATLPPGHRAFEAVGPTWSKQVAGAGRLETYAGVAGAIGDIAAIMTLLPDGIERHIPVLFGGLAGTCSEPGFLRDIAALFDTHFGPAVGADTQRLRAFADFHDVTDKEQILQRLDPDLAIAIRSIWKVPAPLDVLQRRGRRRAR